MMVTTLSDIAAELRLFVEHDLTGVAVEADGGEKGEGAIIPLLDAITDFGEELRASIDALAGEGVPQPRRVARAYLASRWIFETPPPKEKMKIAARVLALLLRFEEVVASKPDLDGYLEQMREAARDAVTRRLSINWNFSTPQPTRVRGFKRRQ
jgi:hypothetical protein